jgi:hypothetical protein
MRSLVIFVSELPAIPLNSTGKHLFYAKGAATMHSSTVTATGTGMIAVTGASTNA